MSKGGIVPGLRSLLGAVGLLRLRKNYERRGLRIERGGVSMARFLFTSVLVTQSCYFLLDRPDGINQPAYF